MILQIIGFRFIDPLTMFGLLNFLVLATGVISIIGFYMAGIFIYKYYKKLHEIGDVPKGWKYFFIGLILSSLYQFLKVPFTYKWIYGNIYLSMFLIFQVIVVMILTYGLYLLRKEVV